MLDVIDADTNRIFKVGTGEFTDSLALDPVMCWSDFLLPPFSRRKNVILELKTKTDAVERLMASPYRDRIVVSWSSQQPGRRGKGREWGSISIQKRLQTARRLQAEGICPRFRFDPSVLIADGRPNIRRPSKLTGRRS
ncbi:MAG: hypothetical protein U5R49_24800 [Deltaproteobacteria bacterium]|nr:hypothetical protein [Deltaproteobacteria bacterium]